MYLMLHAAIYRAESGSIIVVEAGSIEYAVSGGNVCAIAQKRGIAGFIVDGVIRDLAEVREAQFPVFARGVMPKPGVKKTLGSLNLKLMGWDEQREQKKQRLRQINSVRANRPYENYLNRLKFKNCPN